MLSVSYDGNGRWPLPPREPADSSRGSAPKGRAAASVSYDGSGRWPLPPTEPADASRGSAPKGRAAASVTSDGSGLAAAANRASGGLTRQRAQRARRRKCDL